MSNDGKSKKAQEDVKDTVAEETNADVKDTVAEETNADVKDTVAEKTNDVKDTVAEKTNDVKDTVAEKTNDVKDTVAEDLGEENYFTNQAKKLREKGGEIVGDYKSPESESPRMNRETDNFRQHTVNRATTEKGRDVFNMLTRKPVVPILIIGAIVLVGILLYAFVQYGNQSYKVETFNASWNQSLDGLRNGNVSVTEYCNHNPHDQKLCDIFWKLKFM